MKKTLSALMLCLVSIWSFGQELIVESTDANSKEVLILDGNENTSEGEPNCVYSNGTCMSFPKGGLTGLYNPALGWSIAQCQLSDGTSIKKESLILITTGVNEYHSFDLDSRILIRFTDGSVSTLYRDKNDKVERKYDNYWAGNTLMTFYESFVRIQLDSETREKLLNPSLGIVKVRIVFSNGNVRDYELTGKRITKFPEELRESYLEASKGVIKKIQNNDDSTF